MAADSNNRPLSPELAPTGVSRTAGLAPGAKVLEGRFAIVRLLGGGGMGQVYEAEQVSLGRRVAIKLLRQDLSLQPGMAERFRREALLLSSVDHPAVVRVIDFGTTDGSACLVMELVSGRTLEEALREGPLPPERAARLLFQLAQGLTEIHARGIVHRDLKPANVILAEGKDGEQARLLDFGIARLAEAEGEADHPVTQVGTVIGTPQFISPEQAVGQSATPLSDVYSFGVLAYQLLTGALPFDGPTPRQFLAQHAHLPPRPILEANPALANHVALCALVTRCLAKEPSQRPQSAAELAQELSNLAPTSPASVAMLPPAPGGGKLRHAAASSWQRFAALPRWAKLTAAGVLVALVAVAVFLRTPAQRVRGLLDEGRAVSALDLLDELRAHGPLTPELLLLRARALHATDKHDAELEQLEKLGTGELIDADEAVFRALCEDLSRGRRSDGVRGLFSKIGGKRVKQVLRDIADSEPSAAQWGAVRFLDQTNMVDAPDLADLYLVSLKSEDCEVKGNAARRLGELGATDAKDALEALAAVPKKPGFLFDENCGQDQAKSALRRLEKKSD